MTRELQHRHAAAPECARTSRLPAIGTNTLKHASLHPPRPSWPSNREDTTGLNYSFTKHPSLLTALAPTACSQNLPLTTLSSPSCAPNLG